MKFGGKFFQTKLLPRLSQGLPSSSRETKGVTKGVDSRKIFRVSVALRLDLKSSLFAIIKSLKQ